MAIAKRIRALILADLNAFIDSVEDPQEILKQAIRDMQEIVGQRKVEANKMRGQQQRLKVQIAQVSKRLDRVNADIDRCLNTEQDKLLRISVTKRLQLIRLQESLEEEKKQLVTTYQERLKKLRNQTRKLRELQAKGKLYLDQMEQTEKETSQTELNFIATGIDDADVELEIIRLKEKNRQKGDAHV